jgi:hypothetical protein
MERNWKQGNGTNSMDLGSALQHALKLFRRPPKKEKIMQVMLYQLDSKFIPCIHFINFVW